MGASLTINETKAISMCMLALHSHSQVRTVHQNQAAHTLRCNSILQLIAPLACGQDHSHHNDGQFARVCQCAVSDSVPAILASNQGEKSCPCESMSNALVGMDERRSEGGRGRCFMRIGKRSTNYSNIMDVKTKHCIGLSPRTCTDNMYMCAFLCIICVLTNSY